MKDIDTIIKKLTKHYSSDRRTTLNRIRQSQKKDPYKTLIACLLSLRTKDETTEKVIRKLFPIASTPEQIINIPTKKLEEIIFSSGHYKKKARTLKHVSKEILNRFNGKVPESESDLLSIKGIGRKTCNIVRGFAFNKLVIPVDVNVHRISNRLNLVQTNNADKTELALTKILPKKYWRGINGLFILHGKSICVPISPHCSKCPINNYCKRINVGKSR